MALLQNSFPPHLDATWLSTRKSRGCRSPLLRRSTLRRIRGSAAGEALKGALGVPHGVWIWLENYVTAFCQSHLQESGGGCVHHLWWFPGILKTNWLIQWLNRVMM